MATGSRQDDPDARWAGIAGVALAGRRRAAALVLLFLASFGVYMSTGHFNGAGDTVPASLMPITLTLHGTVSMDYFAEAKRWKGKLPYYLAETPHGVVSYFPIATGVIATPLLAVPIWIEAARSDLPPWAWVDVAKRLEPWAAAAIAAAAAVLFLVLCLRIGFGPGMALGLTLFFAFGSQLMCTNSQALWQHGPATLFVLATVLAVVEMRRAPGAGWAALLSVAAAVAVAARPQTALLVGPFMMFAIVRWSRWLPALTMPGLPIIAALVAYNLHYFGQPFGGYGNLGHLFGLDLVPAGLAGSLFSPARGLFFYFPIALVSFVLVALRPQVLRDAVGGPAAVGILATILFYASCLAWPAGWSVGPRYLSETQPLILLLFGLALPGLGGAAERSVARLCFGLLLPYCIALQAIVTFGSGAMAWNPDRLDEGDRAIWDFVDNPVTHGFMARQTGTPAAP
jgi:hypothetical protein